jgi:hypothetical protein
MKMSKPLYLHCAKCIDEERDTKISIVVLDDDMFIMCDNHREPIIIVPAPKDLDISCGVCGNTDK